MNLNVVKSRASVEHIRTAIGVAYASKINFRCDDKRCATSEHTVVAIVATYFGF